MREPKYRVADVFLTKLHALREQLKNSSGTVGISLERMFFDMYIKKTSRPCSLIEDLKTNSTGSTDITDSKY